MPQKKCLQNKCLPPKKTCPFNSHPPSILQGPLSRCAFHPGDYPRGPGQALAHLQLLQKIFKGFKAPSRGRTQLGGFDHAGVVACTETPETMCKELLAAQTKEVEQKQKELERKAERERIHKEQRDEAEAQKAQKQ